MTNEFFDTSLYTRAPNISLSGGIALARTLVDRSPRSAPAPVKKSAKKLAAAADLAQAALADRQRELGALSEEDTRLLDQSADAVWTSICTRLGTYAALPAAHHPRSARAADLLVVLFGADAKPGFVRDAYPTQWTAMDTVLRRIDEDRLQKDIDELVGPEFLAEARRIQPLYGAMVKGVLGRDDGSGQNLLEHTRAIRRAIVDYATKVSATVDDDEPETFETARAALRPIEQYRQANARRAVPDAAPAEPSAPAPIEPSAPAFKTP